MFYVYYPSKNLWLQDDERNFGSYEGAQPFCNLRVAKQIAEREGEDQDIVLFVMECRE